MQPVHKSPIPYGTIQDVSVPSSPQLRPSPGQRPSPWLRHYGSRKAGLDGSTSTTLTSENRVLITKGASWVLDGVGLPAGPWATIPPHPRLPEGARRFWRAVGLPLCDGGVVAWVRGTEGVRDEPEGSRVPVGFCRYCLSVRSRSVYTAQELYLAGTWVDPRYRRTGLATRMWDLVLGKLPDGTSVDAVTATPGGTRLVESFIERYPHLHFSICPNHHVRKRSR